MVIQRCGLHDHETGVCSNSIEIIWKIGEKSGSVLQVYFFKTPENFPAGTDIRKERADKCGSGFFSQIRPRTTRISKKKKCRAR